MNRGILISTLFACVGLTAISSVRADTIMDSAQIAALVTGNTLYVEMPEGAPGAPDGGIAPIYYGADGYTAVSLPAGPKLVGVWSMKDGHYCIDWSNGPQNSCTELRRGDAGFVVIDTGTDAPRGIVTRILTGNPENL